MSISKKHYQAIASIINFRTTAKKNICSEHIIKDLADYFSSDNPLFDRDRFLSACGV